jgi:hypothetical protein
MHIARNILVPALGLALLMGCASKRSDVLSGNNAVEMQTSIMRLARNLPSDRRDEFERAVETIMLSTTDRGLSMSEDRLSQQAISQLKGRTAGQVIENAKLIRSASGAL